MKTKITFEAMRAYTASYDVLCAKLSAHTGDCFTCNMAGSHAGAEYCAVGQVIDERITKFVADNHDLSCATRDRWLG